MTGAAAYPVGPDYTRGIHQPTQDLPPEEVLRMAAFGRAKHFLVEALATDDERAVDRLLLHLVDCALGAADAHTILRGLT